jgi:hypothetical protein
MRLVQELVECLFKDKTIIQPCLHINTATSSYLLVLYQAITHCVTYVTGSSITIRSGTGFEAIELKFFYTAKLWI